MLKTSRLLLVGGLLCPCLRLWAQEHGAVVGKVRGADSSTLTGVQVRVEGTAHSVVTDREGIFRLHGIAAGRQVVHLRVLGYSPASFPVDVPRGDTARVAFTLSAVAQALDTVSVQARETSAALIGFEERRARGPGVFFTRDQLDQMQLRQLTDVLRRVAGIQVRSVNGTYGETLVAISRGSRCPMSYLLNGSPFPVPGDVSIDHFIDAAAVVAIEVYTPSELPAQYNSSARGARCGIVGIWTRSSR